MATHAATRNISGLARALAQQGLMSEYEAEALQTQAQSAGISFVEQVLVGKRMTAQQLAVFASRAFGTPLLDLASFDTDQIHKEYVDVKIAQTRRVLPLYKRSNKLYVAISDPANMQALDEVRFKTNLVPEPIVVEDDKLGQAIAKFIEGTGTTLKDMGNLEDMEVGLEDGAPSATMEDDSDVEDAPVVKYIQKLLVDAISAGASDIHFEPYEKFYRVRYRVDGILMEIAQPPLAIKDKVASRIKVISRLDISEKRVPQDGRMKLVLSKTKSIDFRVSTLPTLYGEKIVMRILDSSGVKLGIEALGYEPDQQQAMMFAIGRPYGMILVTGPTGSGKTVSLYTCLNILNQPGVNIATAEDPAEIQLAGVNQVNVNDKAGLTFAAALKAFLRQDPDIIMVGEIRDLETADIAIKAAQTGHLVLSTLHTNDAPDHADADAQHGRRAVQHRVVGDPDHRAAARPPPVQPMQAAGGHSAGGAAARRLHRGRPGRVVAAVRAGRLRSLQGHRLQGTRRHLPDPADHRRHAAGDHAQRQRARHRRAGAQGRRARPAPVGPAQGQGRHHVARRNRSDHQRVTAPNAAARGYPSWLPQPEPPSAATSRNTPSSGRASTATTARCAASRRPRRRPSSRPTCAGRASASSRSGGSRSAAAARSPRRTSRSSRGSWRRCSRPACRCCSRSRSSRAGTATRASRGS